MNEMIAERRASTEARYTSDDLFSILMEASESEFATSGTGFTDEELKGKA